MHRIGVTGLTSSRVGEPDSFNYRGWVQRRLYDEERRRSEGERTFVQYGRGADNYAERKRAFSDLLYLINRHGESGAWLWDPFLDCEAVMRTLFFCQHSGAELRALGAFERRTRKDDDRIKFKDWREQQRIAFMQKGNNYLGLNFEFRCRYGDAGWPFHDRFLIFPRAKQGAMAWSLGTSINSLGDRHHPSVPI